MHASPSLRLAIALSAGLACGALGSWALRQPSSSDSSGVAHGTPSPGHADSRPTLLLPPRLAGADADTALDAYLALTPLDPVASASDIAERRVRLRALLTLLPTSHFDRLFAALATRVGAAEASLRDLAFEIWLERDASAAARWAAALAPGDAVDAAGRARYASDAALVWADSAFDAAYAWAVALSDTALAHDIARKLLSKLAATDPRRALALASSGDQALFASAQQAIFLVWIEHDPAAAFTSLGPEMFETRGNVRNYVRPLAEWAKRDPRAALAWLTSGAVPESPLRDSPFDLILRLVTKDPLTARAFASALTERTDLPEQVQRLTRMLAEWRRQDADAALAWLDSAATLSRRSEVIKSLVEQFAHNGDRPDVNLSFALRLPEGADRDAHVGKALADWAAKAPDAALSWLRGHDKDPSLAAITAGAEASLIAGVAAKLAATDPAAAVAHWEELPAGEGKYAAALTVAQAWAEHDPAAAARWLAPQVPLTAKPRKMEYALQGMVRQWAEKDPDSALRWADSHPDDRLRRTALLSFVNDPNVELYSEGEDRARLVAKITDPALRPEILSRHIRSWLEHDYRAARAWLESTDALSPEQAAGLITTAAPARR